MDDDTARSVFLCLDCGAHFLPPAAMRYPSGSASEAYCTECQPKHSPAEQARTGINLSENQAKPRARRPRRAGTAPAKGGSTQRSKLL
ncbi:hypothetical protein [Streptacidiphilus neutrinimicus]|uniref:hypothetical protein n=1 Tax=Streptacidiphilus neutrinimicus TaxID=105420 RepID=UPI0005A6277F|nr:hypothetical protein [Streptacidiphilus neutrinimicus]